MGGKNPAIVLEDADLDFAAELIVNGAMKHTGQKCTATSKVFVHQSIYDEFRNRVLNKVKLITMGNGLEQHVYMGPIATKAQHEKVLSYIEKGKEEGATLIYGGGIPNGDNYKSG